MADAILKGWLADLVRGKSPKHEDIRGLRMAAGITKPEMAAGLHVSLRGYEEWEAGRQEMHANHWFAMRVLVRRIRDAQQVEARKIKEERESV